VHTGSLYSVTEPVSPPYVVVEVAVSLVPLHELVNEDPVAMLSTHAALFDKYVTMMGRPPPTVTPVLIVVHCASAYVPRMTPAPRVVSREFCSLEKSSK